MDPPIIGELDHAPQLVAADAGSGVEAAMSTTLATSVESSSEVQQVPNIADDEEDISAYQETLFLPNESNFARVVDETPPDHLADHTDFVHAAPAAGYTPTGLLMDENALYLAFPTIYGGHKMKPMYKGRLIPLATHIKSMV
ncbi:hypothetical protein GGH18_001178, partial [Coemansia sp. RSA 530]